MLKVWGCSEALFFCITNPKPKPLGAPHPSKIYGRDLLIAHQTCDHLIAHQRVCSEALLFCITNPKPKPLGAHHPSKSCGRDLLIAHRTCDLLIAHQTWDMLRVWGWSEALFFCRTNPKPKPLGAPHPSKSYGRDLLIAHRTCDLLIAHQTWDLLKGWGCSEALFFCRTNPKPTPVGDPHPSKSYGRDLLIAHRTCDLLIAHQTWDLLKVWGCSEALFFCITNPKPTPVGATTLAKVMVVIY
jgi:hypothetical protein